jgi:hypothetical protein
MTSALILALVATLVANGETQVTAAQVPKGPPQKPDFSGEWALDRQASTLSPGADAVQSGVLKIEHREPMFRSDAEFIGPTGPVRYAYELLTDGREVTATQKGIASVSSLRWDGDALVFTGRIQRADGDLTISFRYELIDAGRGLRAVEQLRGRGRDQDNIWVFQRIATKVE